MKKLMIVIISLLAVFALLYFTGIIDKIRGRVVNPAPTTAAPDNFSYVVTKDNIKYRVKAEGNNFYFYNKGKWEKFFIKGMNLGATKPGIFPGELTISYEEYYHWFGLISAMNINSVRVYTVMRPQFYNALLDFNAQAEKPLYLFQGVWINEDDINTLSDVYAQNGKIMNQLISDALDAVNVIHGKAELPIRAGYASGSYTADVSKYLAGWILGIEWDPKLVKTTNDSNQDKSVYDGEYLYTLSATPFEAFLCRVGDAVIKYQTSEYAYQVPLAFSNWVTTDPITHPNEPHPDEDTVAVNVENIKSRNNFYSYLYASYHAYSYYPDSLNYQRDYLEYVDPYGKANPYRAYLHDLKMAHTIPIVVGEFGIPTARGMGHESVMGYNQGKVDETAQGDMLLDMMNSIYEENYAGGFLFSWQDEWFKRTWNNEKFDVADARPFWSNIQTNEQGFGILTFDPGAETSICYIDGDKSEWGDVDPVLINDTGAMRIKSDERYLYIMIETSDSYDFDTDTLYIPIDTIGNQGNFSYNGTNASFDRAADFVITINGQDNTRIVVDSYYDAFYFLYGEQYKMIEPISDIRTRNSGRFYDMLMCYGYEMTIPPEGTTIPFKSFETGKLAYGNGNPASEDYRSLSDFIYKDHVLEMRIPWQLLNVMDPSGRKIMNDLYAMKSITAADAGEFHFGLGKAAAGRAISLSTSYTWEKWTVPTYHERLKPSYYVLQEGLKKFN